MMKKNINQKIISQIKFYKMNNLDTLISNSPISRFNNKGYFIKIDKKNKLNLLKEKIIKINNYETKNKGMNIIFSDGNIDSQIMIIGDFSKAKNDEREVPFMGPEGELLDKMLHAINLDRSNVYITNVINYKLPNDKKLDYKEIKKNIPCLLEHIEIINPKILILLGEIALQSIIGNEANIFKQRGVWFKKKINNNSIDIMATFHPAFLIKQTEQKIYSWNDLKLVREKIKFVKI